MERMGRAGIIIQIINHKLTEEFWYENEISEFETEDFFYDFNVCSMYYFRNTSILQLVKSG